MLEWVGDAYQVEVRVGWTAAREFGVLPSTPVRYRTETAMPLSEWLSGLILEASGGRMKVHRVRMRARRAVITIDGEDLQPAATRPSR